jgi:adenylate cyclase
MAENRVRITAQLIDAIKGNHLWAESYDRELKDIFAIQDEITIKILAALRFKLTNGENPLVLRKWTDNLQAYLKNLEGLGYMSNFKFDEASRCFKEARTLDPKFAVAYGWEASAQVHKFWFGPSSTRAQSLKKAFESGKKCAALDDELAFCNMVLGVVYLSNRVYDKAISEGKRAVERWPNDPEAATYLAWTLLCVGRYEEALRELERALRLDPIKPVFTLTVLGGTYRALGRYEDAIATCKKAVELSPNSLPAYLILTLSYSLEGRMDEARSAAVKVMKIQPNFSAKDYVKMLPLKNETQKDLILSGLQKAGLN